MKSPRSLNVRARRLLGLVTLALLPAVVAFVAVGAARAADDGGDAATRRAPARGGTQAQPVSRTAPRSRRTARANAAPRVDCRWLEDIEEAKRLSKSTGKPILASFSGSDWCGWCIRLNREVFSTSSFATWARDNVILLDVDFPRRGLSAAQKKKNRALQERYGVRGFPTVLFLNADGKVLARSGYREGGASAWTRDAAAKLGARRVRTSNPPRR